MIGKEDRVILALVTVFLRFSPPQKKIFRRRCGDNKSVIIIIPKIVGEVESSIIKI
jgi:hypothetical protein